MTLPIEDGKVIEIGNKIAKIPISSEKARMILDAEKYGVVKEVITIAAIIEVGGLIQRRKKDDPRPETRYSRFTKETTSDLLAELDVWKYLTTLKNINFEAIGVSERNFYKAKDRIDQIIDATQGMIEISSSDDREAILMACLSPQILNIHRLDLSGKLVGEDGVNRILDRRSCLKDGYIAPYDFLLGEPVSIPCKSTRTSLELLTFATKVNSKFLLKLVPNRIEFKEELEYDSIEDAIIVIKRGYFRGDEVFCEKHVDYNHPKHEILKDKYKRRCSCTDSAAPLEKTKKDFVVIDGKVFKLSQFSYDPLPKVSLDLETVFTTTRNVFFLDDGTQVDFTCSGRKARTITELRNAMELRLKASLVQKMKDIYEDKKVSSYSDLLLRKGRLGEVQLYDYYGNHKHTFGSVYVCLYLDKNTVTFKVVEDEETANSNTLTAIQYLFMKEVNSLYGESKFSHLPGSKKKVLTSKEAKHKADFDSFVRECMPDLSVENVPERLELLAEFYQELMEADY